MRLVIDANRLYSAVLRDGETRHLIFTMPYELFAPMALREEVDHHLHELVRRSGSTPDAVQELLGLIFARITWVADSAIEPFVPPAKAALEKRDPGDVVYLACALAIDAAGIWSHDKDFDGQGLVIRRTNALVAASSGSTG